MQLITRDESLKRGERKYFTGKPCARGHIVERYTNTRACVECVSYYQKRRSRRYRISRAPTLHITVQLVDLEDAQVVRDFVNAINEARRIMIPPVRFQTP